MKINDLMKSGHLRESKNLSIILPQQNHVKGTIMQFIEHFLSEAGSITQDLNDYSLETVQMFRDDAIKAGFTLETEVEG